MIGLVLVSHSRRLAEGVAELAAQTAGAAVRVAAAGGLAADPGALGTDATLVAAAVDEAWSPGGVLLLMDLGSAVLSAGFALDLLPEERRAKVLLTAAPFVEGAVAAAVAAARGATLEQAAAEARGGLTAKTAQLEDRPYEYPGARPPEAAAPGAGPSLHVTVRHPLGLHARPAALLVRTAAGFDARVTLADLTTGRGPVDARSLNAVGTLGARQGDDLLVEASGSEAAAALEAVRRLAAEGFGEPAAAQEPAAPGGGAAAAEQPAAAAPAPPLPGATLTGIPVSPGVALGPARGFAGATTPPAPRVAGDPAAEWDRLERALAATGDEIRSARDAVAARAGSYEAAIFDAHLLFLQDDALLKPARDLVTTQGEDAAHAWSQAVAQAAAQWERLDDPYLRARGGDLRAVGDQVLARLHGEPAAELGASAGRRPAAAPGAAPAAEARHIVVAADLTPAQTAALDTSRVAGVACAGGGPTSHSAILARALGVPCVAGLGDAVLAVPDGVPLLLDGGTGAVVVDPPPQLVAAAEARRAGQERAAGEARARAHEPAVTADGVTIEVAANVGAVKDVADVLAAGADAVGLLRTEFIFLRAARAPSEREQEQVYRAIAEGLGGRPLTVRTLDAGADKPLPFLPATAEQNPFLGVRGIRLGLRYPGLLREQLRAVLRVGAGHPVRVMFPMIATLGELLAAREALRAAEAELLDAGAAPGAVQVGIMVEVPAAALVADRLAPHVDFFSVGTNDLAQYTLAAERGNPDVAGLADPLQPAVLQLIARTAEAAAAAGCWAGVCGEVAGDPSAVPVLLGLGVAELSVAPPRVAAVKQAVRATDLSRARDLAARALLAASAAEVRGLCETA